MATTMRLEQEQRPTIASLCGQLVRALLHRWWTVLAHDKFSIVEILFGFGAVLWGAFLLGTWDAFSSPGWAIIRATGIPENIYGAWFITLGVLQLVEVPSRWGRIGVAFLLTVTWGLILLALVWINPGTTGTPMYTFPTVVEAGLFVRLLSEPDP